MSFTYRGLKATLDRHIVTPEEIEHNLVRLQQQNFRIAEILDRATENGDEVVLDYAGYCDGVQFAGGTAQNQTLVLGSGMFIPGFEEQLLDKVPGEEVIVKVTFPQQYHAPELAGKEAEFHCKIHEIRVKTEYQLDDVFAKEVGGCETFEQMRALFAKTLQDYTDERGELELRERLLRMAADSLEFTPSEMQIENELTEQMNMMKAQLAQQGLSMEMYCQFMNTTEEQLREDNRSTAEVTVRIQATIEQIAYTENMEATEEEITEMIATIARQNHMTMEQMQPHIDGEFSVAVVRSVLTNKVLKLLRDTAEIEVVIGK